MSGRHDKDAWVLEDLQKTKVSTLLRVSVSGRRNGSFMADVRGSRGGWLPPATTVGIHRNRSVSSADAISPHSRSVVGISDHTLRYSWMHDQAPSLGPPTGKGLLSQHAPLSPTEEHMDIECMEFRWPFNPPPLQNQVAHTSPTGILQDE